MPFINESLDDIHESQPVPEGEYTLRIIKAEETESKSGLPMIRVMIRVEGETAASPINHFLLGWDDETPDDQVRMRKLEIKRFCAAFDVSTDFEDADLEGLTAHDILVVQEEGGDGVIYNRIKFPRIKD
jgi:hypothetical protein